ncbi:hypothetical protein PVL29_012902 [Vitis rotundifolia]|uniref:Uncharacterized protein n=1 Tax=Vitis rotundifolia TaxID=103349 RepID=A0AA38ZK01_VITRO|nr:hypothetical protein PVL29_012902 [Vitis rotundifolia]
MGLRLGFIFLLLGFALVVESFSFADDSWDDTQIQLVDGTQVNATDGFAPCDGAVGDCIDEDDEMMMDSETNRRSLAQGRRYISYGALKRNQVPCNRRGRSYYNCRRGGRANPYRRGCSVITKCHRFTN